MTNYLDTLLDWSWVSLILVVRWLKAGHDKEITEIKQGINKIGDNQASQQTEVQVLKERVNGVEQLLLTKIESLSSDVSEIKALLKEK